MIVKTSFRFLKSLASSGLVSVAVSLASAFADQITLQNGDVLNGKVLNLTTNTLTIQDDNLGTLILARAKVANIKFGTVAAKSTPARPAEAVAPGAAQMSTIPQASSAAFSDLRGIAREIHEHSNLVQEVEAQVLGSSASPAAVNKFNEILDELGSGQMDMNGLRAEAQSAADQLQDYKKQMGPDTGEEVDGYLSILNAFLRETASTNSVSP